MAQHGGPVPFSSSCIDSSTVLMQKPSSSSICASEQGREDMSSCSSWLAAQPNVHGQTQYPQIPSISYTQLHQQSNGSPCSPDVRACLRHDQSMPFTGWSRVGQPAVQVKGNEIAFRRAFCWQKHRSQWICSRLHVSYQVKIRCFQEIQFILNNT